MIFCTVGTHEDPFDRLVRKLDTLSASGALGGEPVHVQTGYSTVEPTACTWEKLIGFDEVQRRMREARVVITHGGPASIMQALALGKVPVVVPRQSRFGEHVDDHQVLFSRRIADRVIVVLDIDDLGPALVDHAARVRSLGPAAGGPERARAFAARLDALCATLVQK